MGWKGTFRARSAPRAPLGPPERPSHHPFLSTLQHYYEWAVRTHVLDCLYGLCLIAIVALAVYIWANR